MMRHIYSRQRWCCLVGILVLATVRHCAAETRICLNMIVKDEADEILDCLTPLVEQLHGWTLCDTGSTDDTTELVAEFFEKNAVPGMVANHDWKDFAHNRNLCYKEGVEWSLQEAKRQGLTAGSHFCDYLLFLDADQILQRPAGVQPGALKAMELNKDSYFFKELGAGTIYKNLRLASTRVDWIWVGAVHEYIRRKDGAANTQHELQGYWLTHDASGGKGSSRYEQDAIILTKAVADDPKDVRARFHLANTMRALGKHEEAISHYTKRVQMGSWDEERFISALNIADISRVLWERGHLISPQVKAVIGNWDSPQAELDNVTLQHEQQQLESAMANLSALWNVTKDWEDPMVKEAVQVVDKLREIRRHREFPWLVSAYHSAAAILPYRPEPRTTLAKMYRQEKSDFARCYSYAATALAQGPPRADALFLSANISTYETLDEMCACAYYVGQVKQGRLACRKLERRVTAGMLLSPGDSYLQDLLDRLKYNLEWYDKKLPEKAAECAADDAQCEAKQAAAAAVAAATEDKTVTE